MYFQRIFNELDSKLCNLKAYPYMFPKYGISIRKMGINKIRYNIFYIVNDDSNSINLIHVYSQRQYSPFLNEAYI